MKIWTIYSYREKGIIFWQITLKVNLPTPLLLPFFPTPYHLNDKNKLYHQIHHKVLWFFVELLVTPDIHVRANYNLFFIGRKDRITYYVQLYNSPNNLKLKNNQRVGVYLNCKLRWYLNFDNFFFIKFWLVCFELIVSKHFNL